MKTLNLRSVFVNPVNLSGSSFTVIPPVLVILRLAASHFVRWSINNLSLLRSVFVILNHPGLFVATHY
jgi:hypothetical protein